MHIGTVLIFLSLVLSTALFFLLCISHIRKKDYSKATERLFYASGLLIILCVVLLFIAFAGNRFDLSYVYNYSSEDLNIFYKLSAFWAGQEGTFLLWIFLLFIFGALILKTRDDYTDIVFPIIVLTQVFILIVLARQSPFEYIWQTYKDLKTGQIPVDGSGLNPLLQDPWMIIHPPVLFMGYASAVIPYAYAVAGLIKRDYSQWISKAYKWVLFCMTSLGIGIFLGGYWAYKVLGWGGYWGWDPVENSSLIPWLTIVALMHGLLIQKKKNVLIKTNITLAIISLALVFYSTFLTRSGVLSDFSVHSFGDLGLKAYLVFFIVIFLFAGIFLLLKRYRDIKSATLDEKFMTGTNSINYGIILLLIYTLFILTGTSMPIISRIILPAAASVTPKYYNAISVPFGILLLIILITATVYRSRINKIKTILMIAVFSTVASLLLNIFYTRYAPAYIFSMLGFFIIIQNILDLARTRSWSVYSSRLAHLGIGILVIGIITSNLHSYSLQKELVKDIETEAKSIKLTFKGYDERSASLKYIYRNKENTKEIGTPYYFSKKTNSLIREPYIDYGLCNDIYISPVEYADSSEGYGKILISKGEEKIFDSMKIRFTGYDMDKNHMKSANPKLFVNLDVNINGKSHTVKPGLIIKGDNKRERIDALIPVVNRKVSLLDFNIAGKEILIYIEPGKKTAAPEEAALVEVSFKRMVWVVWLGTISIALAGFIAVKKSKLQ